LSGTNVTLLMDWRAPPPASRCQLRSAFWEGTVHAWTISVDQALILFASALWGEVDIGPSDDVNLDPPLSWPLTPPFCPLHHVAASTSIHPNRDGNNEVHLQLPVRLHKSEHHPVMTGRKRKIRRRSGYCLVCLRQVDGARPTNKSHSRFGEIKVDFCAAPLAA